MICHGASSASLSSFFCDDILFIEIGPGILVISSALENQDFLSVYAYAFFSAFFFYSTTRWRILNRSASYGEGERIFSCPSNGQE